MWKERHHPSPQVCFFFFFFHTSASEGHSFFSFLFFVMLQTKIVPNFDKFLSIPLASGLNFFPTTEKKFQVLTSIHQDLLPLYNCFYNLSGLGFRVQSYGAAFCVFGMVVVVSRFLVSTYSDKTCCSIALPSCLEAFRKARKLGYLLYMASLRKLMGGS